MQISSKRDGRSNALESQRSCRFFYAWLLLLFLFFSSLAGTLIWLQERLVSLDKQNRLVEYTLTFILLYAYARMVMHHVTKRALAQNSPTFPTMPVPVQEDCAYMLVDGMTGFLWAPVVILAICRVFLIGDRQLFFEEMGPFLYPVVGAYHVDRIMQLLVHFRMDRFLHHVLTCCWSLFVLEWWKTGRDPVIFGTGVLMEASFKFLFFWFTAARFARRHAKNFKADTESADWPQDHEDQRISCEIQGIDWLFISSSPHSMATIGRFFLAFFLVFFCAFPVALQVLYFVLYYEDTSLFSMILIPILTIIFFAIDKPVITVLFAMARVDYWSELRRHHPKELEDQDLEQGSSSISTDSGSND